MDIMVGVKYLKYFPEQIFRLPTGLTIYNAAFNNYDGSKGVIAGPHASFTKDWEQVGQMAYSYNVRPEFPQFQSGIVVTQYHTVTCLWGQPGSIPVFRIIAATFGESGSQPP